MTTEKHLKSENLLVIMGKIKIVLEQGQDGWLVATCPSLPPCISQGKTKEEALANIKEAIELYLEVAQEDNDPIPPSLLDGKVEVYE